MDPSAVVYTALISAGMVPLVSLLKREHWPNQLKFFIAMAASIAAAAIETAVNNHVHSWAQFIALWGVALAASQTVFHFYFNGSDFENLLNASPPPPPPPTPSVLMADVVNVTTPLVSVSQPQNAV